MNNIKVWTVEEMETHRREQWDSARQIREKLKEYDRVAVVAEVKSGKREIKIACRLRGLGEFRNTEQHIYLTGLNRTDTEPQMTELKANEFKTIKLSVKTNCTKNRKQLRKSNSVTSSEDAIGLIRGQLSDNKIVFMHVDESDYGTEIEGKLDTVIKEFEFEKNIKWIFYSATNHEVLSSKYVNESARIYHNNSKNYCGAKFFYENGLVKPAVKFFDFPDNSPDNITKGELTEQGKEAIQKLLASDIRWGYIRETNGIKEFVLDSSETGAVQVPPIGILRVAGNDKDNSEFNKLKKSNFESLLNAKGIQVKWIDSRNNSNFNWSDVGVYTEFSTNYKYLLVINQKCTRSTEIKCHPFLVFWHEYRSDSSTYNTIIQSQLRIAHYAPNGNGYQILLYGDKLCMEFEAKLIGYDEYVTKGGRPLSGRVNTPKKNSPTIGNFKIDIFEYEKANLDYLKEEEKKLDKGSVRKELGESELGWVYYTSTNVTDENNTIPHMVNGLRSKEIDADSVVQLPHKLYRIYNIDGVDFDKLITNKESVTESYNNLSEIIKERNLDINKGIIIYYSGSVEAVPTEYKPQTNQSSLFANRK